MASGAASVARTTPLLRWIRMAQSARKATGRRSTTRSRASEGSPVSSSTTSRSRNRLPPAAYRLIHMTVKPSRALHADTIESGIAPPCISSSTSSIAVPSPFSTISIASMWPPDSPIAVARRPRDPGTSGSSTRRRNGTPPTLGDLGDAEVSSSGRGRQRQSLTQAGRAHGAATDGRADVVGRADHDHALAGARDRGVEELAGEQPGLRRRQDHHDLVGLAALALVDRQRVHALHLGEPAGGEVEPAPAAGDGGPQSAGLTTAGRRSEGHPHVTVIDAEPVVVGGDQQRPTGIPRRPDRLPGLLTQPALHLGVPLADAEGPFAVCAQQPLLVEELQRAVGVTALR